MQIVVIHEDSDKPWSFTGWQLKYVQLTATTWGYQFVDPAGTMHKDMASSNNNGFYLVYNCNSFTDFFERAINGSHANNAMVKYRLSNAKPETVNL